MPAVETTLAAETTPAVGTISDPGEEASMDDEETNASANGETTTVIGEDRTPRSAAPTADSPNENLIQICRMNGVTRVTSAASKDITLEIADSRKPSMKSKL